MEDETKTDYKRERFTPGQKVIFSDEAYKKNAGREWFETLVSKMKKTGFLVISSSLSWGGLKTYEIERCCIEESWLEPYKGESVSAPLLSGPLYRPAEDKMTLRNQFAMAALMGLAVGNIDLKTETIVTEAYKIADAMMERRKG